MKEDKWIRVSEYARKEGISVAGVHKRIKSGSVESKKEYGLTLIKVQ